MLLFDHHIKSCSNVKNKKLILLFWLSPFLLHTDSDAGDVQLKAI